MAKAVGGREAVGVSSSRMCRSTPRITKLGRYLSRRQLVGAEVGIFMFVFAAGWSALYVCERAHVFAKEDSFFVCMPDLIVCACVVCLCVYVVYNMCYVCVLCVICVLYVHFMCVVYGDGIEGYYFVAILQ